MENKFLARRNCIESGLVGLAMLGCMEVRQLM